MENVRLNRLCIVNALQTKPSNLPITIPELLKLRGICPVGQIINPGTGKIIIPNPYRGTTESEEEGFGFQNNQYNQLFYLLLVVLFVVLLINFMREKQ